MQRLFNIWETVRDVNANCGGFDVEGQIECVAAWTERFLDKLMAIPGENHGLYIARVLRDITGEYDANDYRGLGYYGPPSESERREARSCAVLSLDTLIYELERLGIDIPPGEIKRLSEHEISSHSERLQSQIVKTRKGNPGLRAANDADFLVAYNSVLPYLKRMMALGYLEKRDLTDTEDKIRQSWGLPPDLLYLKPTGKGYKSLRRLNKTQYGYIIKTLIGTQKIARDRWSFVMDIKNLGKPPINNADTEKTLNAFVDEIRNTTQRNTTY